MTSTGDHDPCDPPGALSGVRYGQRALDLVRYLDYPADDFIAAIVDGAERLTPIEREAFRSKVDEAEAYTLLTFARRRATTALRTKSLERAIEAIGALTLVTRDRIDFRDLRVDFPLFAVHQLGGDIDEVVRRAVESSDRSTADSFAVCARSAHYRTLARCGLVEVRSSHGLGFMDTWSSRYDPRTDLGQVAVQLADGIDTNGRYVVDSIHGSDLPGVWFGTEHHPINVPVTSCVSVSARLSGTGPWSHGLLIFIAELPRRRTAAGLARRATESSTSDRPRTAIALGRRLAVIVGGSTTVGEDAVETTASLLPIRDLAASALSD